MNALRSSIVLLLALFATSVIGQTAGVAERRYTLPDHGQFVLQVPRGWRDELRQPPNRLPPTIVFGPASGKSFQILMTTLWPATKGRAPQSPAQLRASVERAAQAVKSQAVEKELPVVEFNGRSGPGFYFSATDPAPKPGEYRFMTQGIIRVGGLSVTFTILTNAGQASVVKQALAALESAVQDGG
jgi:hypothetical protein